MVTANNNIERCFGVTNIKHHIPLILDLEDQNYDAWRELFQTHCMTFDVSGHIDGTLLPTSDADTAWYKRDGLVKLWIYGTLAPPLFRSSFKTSGSARDIWLRVENQFGNNKEARAIQLDNELRTMEIGDLSIRDYCQKIKSVADLLANVDAAVNEQTLVMYLLNGLNDKFDNILNVIKHKEPFPSFDVDKSMLELEENRLKKVPRSSAAHNENKSNRIIEESLMSNDLLMWFEFDGRARAKTFGSMETRRLAIISCNEQQYYLLLCYLDSDEESI